MNNPRPVYLTDDFVKKVVEENQALKIIAHEKADSWIPVSRIARIIIIGNIDVTSNTLSYLMQQGIPISFADSSGSFTGVALGSQQRPNSLDAELQEYFSYEEGKELLENWFAAQETRLIQRIKKRFHIPKAVKSVQDIQQALNHVITLRYHYRYWMETQEKLQPMLAAQQSLLLQHYGYTIALIRPGNHSSGLLKHLMQLVSWELWQLAARGHLPVNNQRKQLAHYYQQHQYYIEKHTLDWIGKLWKRMNELHYEQQY